MSTQVADQRSPTANETTTARERADAIRRGIEATASALAEVPELVKQAYKPGDWRTLGYESWEGYVHGEFRTSLIRLDVATRKTWTHSLREAGMSTREIAPVTNVSQMQVSRDERETNVSPRQVADACPSPDKKLLKETGRACKSLLNVRDMLKEGIQVDCYTAEYLVLMVDLVKEIINFGKRKRGAVKMERTETHIYKVRCL